MGFEKRKKKTRAAKRVCFSSSKVSQQPKKKTCTPSDKLNSSTQKKHMQLCKPECELERSLTAIKHYSRAIHFNVRFVSAELTAK